MSWWVVCLGTTMTQAPWMAPKAKLLPVPHTAVTFEGGFWEPRLRINRERTLPHNWRMCEETGRLRNFAQAAGLDPSPYAGHYFHDSDVYKVIEGASYCLATHPDPQWEARLDALIELIAKAQWPDGYLNTWFTLKEPQARWTDMRVKHELYCAGHLIEAAVAHHQATGKRTLLEVALRFADHIDRTFGPGKRHVVPDHEEIELALIKLWRLTGEERYLRLAQFFVDEHGRAETHELFGPYCQDHKPIREQDEAVGHCVRAMYLYSAVADLAAITGDEGYIEALEKLWQDVVYRKMYITGGIGVQGHGEGFARPYFLPNEDAYAETCAAIGMIFWNHRLTLLHGQGRFADIVERVLYNGALSGVSLDGTKFFYVNPLASRGRHHRQPWFDCACCPPNILRLLASLGGYLYATSADGSGIWLLHYAQGRAQVPLGKGQVGLRQETRYPWEGEVRITVEPQGLEEFTVHLRIPGWCQRASVKVNGRPVEEPTMDGFVALRRPWRPGDLIELNLPMPAVQVEAPPEVEANRGRRALQRGPIVYCLEDADHPIPVSHIAIPPNAELEAEWRPDLLGGGMVLRGKGLSPEGAPLEVTAIPYHAWDNRRPGEMVVWVPMEPSTPKEGEGP